MKVILKKAFFLFPFKMYPHDGAINPWQNNYGSQQQQPLDVVNQKLDLIMQQLKRLEKMIAQKQHEAQFSHEQIIGDKIIKLEGKVNGNKDLFENACMSQGRGNERVW